MKLGNGWETAKFNTRLQVTELGLGSSAANTGLWKTSYEYGELQTNGTVDAAKNTGNIARQTLTVPGTSFTQSYKYDSLYRLTEATEKTGSTQNWTQSWNYDRYGNRVGFSQNVAGFTDSPNPAVDANTNRFSSGQGFTYDLSGNLVIDNEGRQFTFNGDNKQTVVKDAANNVIGQYFYDGEGKRVKKITNSETTVFVYSSGKLIAEYSDQVSQTPTVAYTTTDHLGSPRIITDQFGQVKSRRDFMPFGEDIFQNVGASRTASLGYSTSQDDLRQKFTGYQKDPETHLDFAEARMYENRFGRFTAVDPLLASGKSAHPQTFNRFAYVGNNPTAITDPSGLIWYFKEKLNRYDWWDEEKQKFKWSGGGLTEDWSLATVGVGAGNFVYQGNNGLWYSLNPNSSDYSYWVSQERAEWDNGYYTGFNGYGKIPVWGTFVLPMISGIKTGNVERAMYGFWGTAATLATVPRTVGGLLKEGAQEGLSYITGLPIFNPFKKPLSNEDIVQKAANIAERKVGGVGAVPGTLKHSHAAELIDRYQRRFGDRGLKTETSWMNGSEVVYGTKGSVRFDVTDITNGTSYDFKFTLTRPALTQRRIDQLLNHGPTTIKTVKEINPQ